MKYIFVAGAPGSKWSSVCKNIYNSPNIDRSDFDPKRVYSHSANGKEQLMHMGAYYDPKMDYGYFFHHIDRYTKEECEEEFNRPFSGGGSRIIRSHQFCHHIDFLKKNWSDCPVVLVHREDDACLGWWVRCGHFNIKYPNYSYYKNLEEMARHIDTENADLLKHWKPENEVRTNKELCEKLGIEAPEDYQNYADNDIKVCVI